MKMQLRVDGSVRSVELEPGERDGLFTGALNGEPVVLEAVLLSPSVVSLVMRSGPLAGRAFHCVFERDGQGGKSVSLGDQALAYEVYDPRSYSARKRGAGQGEGTLLLKASMAGRVVRVLVEPGAEVEAHAGVVVIEAMKMQNEIRSAKAGRVTEMRVTAGEMVSAGQVLAVID